MSFLLVILTDCLGIIFCERCSIVVCVCVFVSGRVGDGKISADSYLQLKMHESVEL